MQSEYDELLEAHGKLAIRLLECVRRHEEMRRSISLIALEALGNAVDDPVMNLSWCGIALQKISKITGVP